jgi:excisionase family DNA binding protein
MMFAVTTGEEGLGLTVDQVAEFLCVERDDVLDLLERGVLAGLKAAGHEWRIPWQSVEEFLASPFDEDRQRPVLRRWAADPRTWDRARAHRREDVIAWLEARDFEEQTIGALFKEGFLEAMAQGD